MTMGLSDSWRAISESLIPDRTHRQSRAPDTKRAEDLQHRTWHALFSKRPRSLLVPANHRPARRGSLRFFIMNPLNLLYAQTLLQANDWLPRANLLPELTLPPGDGPTLLDQLPLPGSSQLAFLVGTPGPYQKASLLFMSGLGKPLALAKIALRSSADNMVNAEACWLRELAECSQLAGKVPKLLKQGKAPNGREYLAQSVAPGQSTTFALTPAHTAFLHDLSRVRPDTARFADSRALGYLIDTLHELETAMSSRRLRMLADAVDDCAQRLVRWQGPVVLAHGDFTPWNVRLQEGKIFVFDWEYAHGGAVPLHDIFHFFLAPKAVSGPGIAPRDLKEVLRRARDFAVEAWPGHDWSARVVTAFGLAYLLHTVLFYSLSRGTLMEKHPLIKAYCELIEARARWMR